MATISITLDDKDARIIFVSLTYVAVFDKMDRSFLERHSSKIDSINETIEDIKKVIENNTFPVEFEKDSFDMIGLFACCLAFRCLLHRIPQKFLPRYKSEIEKDIDTLLRRIKFVFVDTDAEPVVDEIVRGVSEDLYKNLLSNKDDSSQDNDEPSFFSCSWR